MSDLCFKIVPIHRFGDERIDTTTYRTIKPYDLIKIVRNI